MSYNSVSDTTSLAGLAKELYPVDEIKDMEQRVTNFKKEIEEDRNLKFSPKKGGSFIFPVKASGAHGQKMMNEHEALATGKPSSVVQGECDVKEYCGVIEFTKRELELAKNNPAVFADVKTFEMESLIENAHKYFNRQIANGNGLGIMTTVANTVTNSTTIPVADASPFQIGMVLDIWTTNGVTREAQGVVVTDISFGQGGVYGSTVEIVVDVAVTLTSGDYIYLAGVNDNASTDGKEMSGLPLVVDDGTLKASYQGIVRTGAGQVPNYRGIALNASSAPLSTALIAQLMSRALRIGGTDFVNMKDVMWVISPEQWRAYASLAISQIRYAPSDTPDLAKAHGNPTYEIAGKRAVVDTDVDRASAYIMRKSACKIGVATPLDWEGDLGGTTLKWLSGYAQGIMLLYALQQFFSEAPREVAAIQSLATVAV